MKVEQTIFKAYDIRGIYPKQLNEATAYAIGRAYATLLLEEVGHGDITVAVGMDMRISSTGLKKDLVRGLVDSGLNVEDIGLVSTPTFYFTVARFGYAGGVQVSASHNPADWNGFKLVRSGGVPLSGTNGIYKLREIIESEKYVGLAQVKGHLVKREGVVSAMVDFVLSQVDVSQIKPFKVVVDTANAMGSLDCEALFAKLPCELVKMNFVLDGTFPAHEADPFKQENTKDLRERVVEEGAHLGVAMDGDGDRIFFVDELGRVARPEILRGLMAQVEIWKNPEAVVAYDIRPGRITKDMIEEVGGRSVVTKVGHALIKEEMLKTGAVFGGESSGHFFYKFPFGVFELPMLLLLKILAFLSLQDKSFSEILKKYEKYFHSGEINTKLESQELALRKLEEIKQKYSDGQMSFLDGLTVEYPQVWFNVRSSNTEPLLRLNVEAVSQALMEEKREELLGIISA